MNKLMDSEGNGQRPVARPLMNSAGVPHLNPPVLSEKEKEKIQDLQKETKKRKFAAQQLAALRPSESLQQKDFDDMERRGLVLARVQSI